MSILVIIFSMALTGCKRDLSLYATGMRRSSYRIQSDTKLYRYPEEKRLPALEPKNRQNTDCRCRGPIIYSCPKYESRLQLHNNSCDRSSLFAVDKRTYHIYQKYLKICDHANIACKSTKLLTQTSHKSKLLGLILSVTKIQFHTPFARQDEV